MEGMVGSNDFPLKIYAKRSRLVKNGVDFLHNVADSFKTGV